MQTLFALWRGKPQIEQPSNATPHEHQRNHDGAPSQPTVDRAVMPPPLPPTVTQPEETPSPQTTPKAGAAPTSTAVPSLSLSSSPPASAAAVARAGGTAPAPTLPKLSGPPVATPSALMPPPPRPPALNSVNNSRNNYPNGLASAARQPGSSTLAPPPTHSSKPSKPSRKVILEPGHSPLDWARIANSPTSDLRNLPPGTPYLKVTPSMLKKMTGRKGKDAWTALGGRVYNMTAYLPFHPGGEPELMRCAGRDGTKLFGEIHPWVNYEGMLASSLIGMLVEEGEESGNGKMDEMD
ncbi:hypothetical protein TruAng_008346 [Truncatella angustata]|nr:hypothetical protein TruAng_008346 [Truncatella angustata]